MTAVEFIREPRPVIIRHRYNFMIQTHFLTDFEIFTEAYLRGLINGERGDTVNITHRDTLNAQLRCDFERWVQRGQDLTPVIMNHRATVEEIAQTLSDVFDEINRLERINADPRIIGVQLDFAICCLRRTILSDQDEWNQIQAIVDRINEKYAEVCEKIEIAQNTSRVTANNGSYPNMNSSSYYSASSGYYGTPMFGQPRFVVPPFYPQPYTIPQYQMPPQPAPNATYSNFNNNRRESRNESRNTGPATPQFHPSAYSTSSPYFNTRNEYTLIGPHKVSATIISIIGKNVYEPKMDALDQIEIWECQANTLQVPIEFFLSYMEILLAKELQSWWQLHRPRIATWAQFRVQFLEDFGDHNRVIKAEQAVANLTQGQDETFQQLFLRFTKLMSRVKPEKSEADQLYILKSSLKPELRAACISVTTIADLKKLCQEYEGMQKMYSSKESKSKNEKVNIVEHLAAMEIDFWNNEAELDPAMEEDDRLVVIDESIESRKIAMSKSWTKDQKKEWLAKQICWNCDEKGHLQGSCNKSWIPHCVKCGNKKAKNSKECLTCSGNVNPSVSGGARR